MKTKLTKVLALTLCAVLLVVGSVMGTVAYLTSTATVQNTFTYGNVAITMSETDTDIYGDPIENAAPVTSNDYKLIPGKTYKKDTTVTVMGNSEACYLFVKIDAAFASIDSNVSTQITGNGWSPLADETGVYYKTVSASTGNQDFKIIDEFTVSTAAKVEDIDDFNNVEATIVAYAIQQSGFDTTAAAWAQAKTLG